MYIILNRLNVCSYYITQITIKFLLTFLFISIQIGVTVSYMYMSYIVYYYYIYKKFTIHEVVALLREEAIDNILNIIN